MRFNWKKISKRTTITILAIAALLVAARIALPYAVQHYVNNVLNRIPDYRGRIGTVNIKLWRGAYQIQGLKLEKISGNVPVPFFEAKTVDLMIEWRELFHGALVGQITFYEPKLNYVAGPTEEASQTGIDKSWQARVKELFPLQINRFRVVNGEIHFRNFSSQPPVNVSLGGVQIEATNLKNTRDKGENLFATIEATGTPMKGASLRLRARLDPLAAKPAFDLNGELLNAPLVAVNDFFLAYGGFEVSGGRLDVFTELAAENGKVVGYVKPIMRDTAVKVWSGKETNPVQYLWEPLVAVMSLAVKNWPHGQFATKIPVSGDFDDPRVHSWSAFFSLLENAWVESAKPGLENSVDLQTVKKEESSQAARGNKDGAAAANVAQPMTGAKGRGS